jgi:hypothetical protein
LHICVRLRRFFVQKTVSFSYPEAIRCADESEYEKGRKEKIAGTINETKKLHRHLKKKKKKKKKKNGKKTMILATLDRIVNRERLNLWKLKIYL